MPHGDRTEPRGEAGEGFVPHAATPSAVANGIGLVAMRNTNHWIRGGTYGWQAADAGCIGICFTNTMANMPPWGGKEPRLGNNPLIISVPREDGHIVLDMAMTQFSYGKLQDTHLKGLELSEYGGYGDNGNLTKVPSAIIQSRRALPIGFWKGSGLSLMLDVVLTAITGGRSTAAIDSTVRESGVSQFFLCLYQSDMHHQLIEEIIRYTKSSAPAEPGADHFDGTAGETEDHRPDGIAPGPIVDFIQAGDEDIVLKFTGDGNVGL